jgi:hypothetical protein
LLLDEVQRLTVNLVYLVPAFLLNQFAQEFQILASSFTLT